MKPFSNPGMFVEKGELRSVKDRGRRTAFWVSLAAFAQINFIFILYAMSSPMLLWHWGLYIFYALANGAIAWSAWRNWHFRAVLGICYGAMYIEIWVRTYLYAIYPEISATALHVPVLLFLPVFLLLVAEFRTLLGYAVVQAVLVFHFTQNHLASVFGFEASKSDMTEIAAVLAVVSFISLVVLSIVAYSRHKTDKRLIALIRETERLAAEDPLTGLKNRRAFMDDVNGLWAERTPFAVVFFDLDRFKPLNDEYGHAIGDLVLQTVGQRIKTAEGVLSAARFGGDEFAVALALPETGSDLDHVTQHLHHKVTGPIDIEFMQVSVGASFGFARALYDSLSVSDLLHAADTAMMRCKANGGGVAQFDPEQDDISLPSSAISEAFRNALESGQIKPALQPIVDAKTQEVIGHELLARWVDSGLARDPTPAEFIPIAEKLGLLNELLWTTMRVALPHVRDTGHFLSINVCPSQLSSSTFVDDLVAISDQFDFPMDRLELEITEHVAFRNLDANIQTLETARSHGCRIALDDFGSGYSSLSLLEELPLDKVKLDRGFQSKTQKRGVMEATIRLATELGFECCVEGIETAHAAHVATQLGCSQMQGFWFGYPEVIERNIHRLRAVS
ncbi:MAG: EAL domain-containing protein [Pseudomonadota bacterium]